MISMSRAEVPEYLRRSKFFLALGEDDSTSFSVPQECFKAEQTAHNGVECLNLLRTLHFWMVDEPQVELALYILVYNNSSVFEDRDSEERQLLLSLRFGPEYLKLKQTPSCKRIAFATKCGMGVEMVEALAQIFAHIPKDLCSVAAEVGDLGVLKYARSQQCKWGDAAQLAVGRGHVSCVQYAMNHNDLLTLAVEKGQLSSLQALHSNGAVLDNSLCSVAATHGHLHCLQYLHENEAPWDGKTIENAIKTWHNECLMYAHQHGCSVTSDATKQACMHGNYAALHYLIKHDVPVHDSCALMAAVCDELLCLKLAHRLGARWNGDVICFACLNGSLECLRYAHEHGCPWGDADFKMQLCLRKGHISCWLYVLLKSNDYMFDVFSSHEAWWGDGINVLLVFVVQYCREGSMTVASTYVTPLLLEYVRYVLLVYPVQVEFCFPKVRAYACTMYIYALTLLLRGAFSIWVNSVILLALCKWCWTCFASYFFA